MVDLIEGEVVPAAAKDAVLKGELEPKDALEAVQSRAVGNTNPNANRANNGDVGGNGNGPPAHSNAGGNSSSGGKANGNGKEDD